MKEEKVRIKVRLTEEEKEKLERNSALCGLTQSEYVRQLCQDVHPKPKTAGCILGADGGAI